MQNPYPTRKGFGLRLHHARTALEKFGRDYARRPYSRGFDNCFEMFDGEAVVWALMHDAINGNSDLKTGIERMGQHVWPQWLACYNAPAAWQLPLEFQQ